MPQDVQATVTTSKLEIAVVSARPAIENLHDLDATVADEERQGHFFASMARGALHTNNHSRIRFHTDRAGGLSWQADEPPFLYSSIKPLADKTDSSRIAISERSNSSLVSPTPPRRDETRLSTGKAAATEKPRSPWANLEALSEARTT